MKQKTLFLLMAAAMVGIFLTVGCNENTRTRNFGGTMTVTLPVGQKLENATWKQDQMWYLVRPMRSDEVPETHSFKEKSTYGAWEGTVIFQESH
jgi:hypothetical protein